MPPDPLARVELCIVTVYLCTCYLILFLHNKLIIMRNLKNAAQKYTYLMKLKFNKCIGPNSNCTQKYFHFVYKKSSLSCWKKSAPPPPPPPNQKTNGLSLIKKIESREHSAMPTLPGTATAF